MSKRAIRRHHTQRLIQKYYRQLVARYTTMNTTRRQREACLYATTRCRCSCWMCGNPRRHYGNSAHALTRAEVAMTLYQQEEN